MALGFIGHGDGVHGQARQKTRPVVVNELDYPAHIVEDRFWLNIGPTDGHVRAISVERPLLADHPISGTYPLELAAKIRGPQVKRLIFATTDRSRP